MQFTKDISAITKPKKEENKQAPGLTHRHRAGIVPNWVEDESEEEDTQEGGHQDIVVDRRVIEQNEQTDRRVKRLQNKEVAKGKLDERLKMRREIHKSEVIEDKTPEVKEADSKPQVRNRREKVTQEKTLEEDIDAELLELIGEEIPPAEPEEIECLPEIDEEEDDNAETNEKLLRPVYISKDDRMNLNNNNHTDDMDENKLQQQKEIDKHIRKQQTKEIVNTYILKENTKKEEDKIEMPDDTDNLDDLEEYEKWKLRELKRIKKQMEEDEKKLNEILEIERRRNMTNEQRKEENMRLGSDDTLRPFKSKINYLQKYYHKGAFFQQDAKETSEHIYNRDFNLPTWEDKVDRSGLPAMLAKRRGKLFKKGQSKYTHLTNEDTTNFDPNFRLPESLKSRLHNSLAGNKTKDSFDLKRK